MEIKPEDCTVANSAEINSMTLEAGTGCIALIVAEIMVLVKLLQAQKIMLGVAAKRVGAEMAG